MVVDLLVDDVDAVVARLPRLARGRGCRRARPRSPTESPKWSRRGHVIGVVVGDEEHELLDVVHLEHEAVPILGEHRQLYEAEHVARRSRVISRRCSSSSRSGDRLIATWLNRGLRVAEPRALRLGLGCSHLRSLARARSSPSPRARLVQARARRRADRRAGRRPARRAGRSGTSPDASSSSARAKPSCVVDERTRDHELVEQDAVVVEARARWIPAPTSTSVPAALAAARARLPSPAVARALEHDVERLVDDVVRHRRQLRARPGATVRAPELLAQRAAAFVRLAHDDVVDAQRLQRGDRQEADRTAAGDEPARARPGTAAARDAVQRDRQRLGQRGVLRSARSVGDAEQRRPT